MNLGLFDVDKLTGSGRSQGDRPRAEFGDAETDVGNADEVVDAAVLGTRHAPDS